MRHAIRRSWPWLALLLALGAGPRPAAAGEAEEQALRELVARLAAQVEMLAAKVERLDRRLSEMQTRLALGEPKAAPVAAGDGAVVEPKKAAAAEPAPAKSGAPRNADLAARVPTKRAFKHSYRIATEFMEKIDRTYVRLVPFPLEVVSGSGDLAMGALLVYEGRVPSKLPDAVQLDFVSKASHWKADGDHSVTFYVDKARYSLGKASYREEVEVGGERRVLFALPVPLGTFLDIITGTDVRGTLGEVEFAVPEPGLEALRDLVCRLAAPPSAPTAPATAR